MKTLKIKSRIATGILTLGLLMFTACGQQGEKSVERTAGGSAALSEVKAPKVGLQEAVLTDNLEAVRQHIVAGTNIDERDALSGSTPLITAASFNKKEIAEALIDAGADLEVKNNDGATALHTAAFFCRVEIVQLLMDAGANLQAKNAFGATPRESVMGAFDEVKPIYEMLQQQLAPFGMQFDLNEIEKTRPVIAVMLQ
ncbi:ankyrin repeat domain-containing protein [Robertkochia sediminum]|uniref:ankyrin repeat domain-containing protein n=1 Tax=Robertkochia sediminum TaxID=2785326 RepID=UPI001932EC75|nr:ankyrin repeat domain-containing protein [Robertkochia sediminum]MBL7472022.1 ankyrin repeat domain-containing protein [Robertkochia sediminum]